MHENIKTFMQGFRYDAHPMGMLLGVGRRAVDVLSGGDADQGRGVRYIQIVRLLAKLPTLAAFSFRHNRGSRSSIPTTTSLRRQLPSMVSRMTELKYEPDPRLEHALDVLFILHADHEQNCSTNAVRAVGSSQVDPYSAVAAGVAALYGPLHGGANEAVLRMLRRIETRRTSRTSSRREGRQGAPDGLRPPGLQELRPAREDHQEGGRRRFEVTGTNPLLDIALELEKIALEDDYFV